MSFQLPWPDFQNAQMYTPPLCLPLNRTQMLPVDLQ